MQWNTGVMMNFDEELERLLLIEDHDEMLLELSMIEIEFDFYLKELEANQVTRPDWWYIGLGFKEGPNPAAQANAVKIYKEFLKYNPAVECSDFDSLVKLFVQEKTERR
jgi:hypothetical protein